MSFYLPPPSPPNPFFKINDLFSTTESSNFDLPKNYIKTFDNKNVLTPGDLGSINPKKSFLMPPLPPLPIPKKSFVMPPLPPLPMPPPIIKTSPSNHHSYHTMKQNAMKQIYNIPDQANFMNPPAFPKLAFLKNQKSFPKNSFDLNLNNEEEEEQPSASIGSFNDTWKNSDNNKLSMTHLKKLHMIQKKLLKNKINTKVIIEKSKLLSNTFQKKMKKLDYSLGFNPAEATKKILYNMKNLDKVYDYSYISDAIGLKKKLKQTNKKIIKCFEKKVLKSKKTSLIIKNKKEAEKKLESIPKQNILFPNKNSLERKISLRKLRKVINRLIEQEVIDGKVNLSEVDMLIFSKGLKEIKELNSNKQEQKFIAKFIRLLQKNYLEGPETFVLSDCFSTK